jgi:hypothetical protein
MKEVVYRGDSRSEQHPDKLVEGHGRVRKRKIREHDLKIHGHCKGQDIPKGGRLRSEEIERGMRNDVKGNTCEGKVERREEELTISELWVAKDGFVGEDLFNRLGQSTDSRHDHFGQ